MSAIPIRHIATLHVNSDDLMKVLRKKEVMAYLTIGELQDLKESIDLELNSRENQRKEIP